MYATHDPLQCEDLLAHPCCSASEVGGTKTSLSYLWQRLRENGVDIELLWENICELAVRSLVCVDDVIPYQPNSFEVGPFDTAVVFGDACSYHGIARKR